MTDSKKIINHISMISILGNILLTAFKLFAGITGHSGAMISDAIHSMSDIITTFIAWLGVRFSAKEADKSHPYGHERMECVASLILGMILLITGFGIGYSGMEKITVGNYEELAVPGTLALLAAFVSIAVKEAMYWYTRHYAKILNSASFMADAWHHRSDALSSIGSLLGISGAILGFPVLDPIASIVICLFILKAAYDILRDAITRMLDTACSPELETNIGDYISSCQGVNRLDMLHTRMFGNMIYIDAEIAVDGEIPLKDAHAIAEKIHDGVEDQFENIKHIMIHVNPV